jgi:nodulation protein E
MTRRRVVVTGLGVISALGKDREEFWNALVAGRSGIAPITTVDHSRLSYANGAEVHGFAAAAYFDDRNELEMDRFVQFGAIAAREAIADSGLTWSEAQRSRTAVVTGSCCGGAITQDVAYERLFAQRREKFHPQSIPRIMANAAASYISMRHGLRGPTFNLSTACSSSNHAIGLAAWLVRDGGADCAIAGGSEAPFSLGNLKAWDAIRAVSPDTCRPFSKDRKGMILGEGGAMLVLETLDAALARGARIYAEIGGFGMTADAHHLTQPSLEGPVGAMRAALADADIAPELVGYVNAHGTGTETNDSNETRAIHTVFGAHAPKLAVSSTKSMHGHALGAAGALEAAATVLALHHGILPPTANFTEPDPACDLDVIPNRARPQPALAALSNSFAFGGLNAVLAFRRVDAIRSAGPR